MKIQASLLAALTAQNQVEAFWNPFSMFTPSSQTQSQPMPAQIVSVEDPLCQDDFLRCSSWKHACGVKSIDKICAKTCGKCGGVSVSQQYPAPAAPVVQVAPEPVAPEPVQQEQIAPAAPVFVDPAQQVLYRKPASFNFFPRPVQQVQLAPVQPVFQPIYQVPVYQAPVQQASCADKFSSCSAWKSVCNNASIQNLCPGTCGLCGTQVQIQQPVQIQQVAPAPVPAKQAFLTPFDRPAFPRPVEEAPVFQQIPVVQTPAEKVPVAVAECKDKYNNCQKFRDQCSNRIILNVCQKSCGACASVEYTMPTMPPTMAPTTISTTTTTASTTTTEEPEASGNGAPWENIEEEAFEAPKIIEPTSTTSTTTTTEPMTTTMPEEITEIVTEYPSGEGPVPIPAEENSTCKDFMVNCEEFSQNQYRFCSMTPEDALFSVFKPIMESCRKTCGFCDQNAACAGLVDFCHEEKVAATCPGTCRGLEPMEF